jgi:S1-C subfamily serine protease
VACGLLHRSYAWLGIITLADRWRIKDSGFMWWPLRVEYPQQEGSFGKEADMAKMSARIRRSLGSRRVRPAMLGIVLALVVVAGSSLVLGACTFEWGGKTTSTVTTTVGVTGSTETTSDTNPGATSDSSTTSVSVDVVTESDGLASPAQAVAALLGPSVVNIAATGTESFSQGPQAQEYEYAWEGSGVIYSDNGMIITNNHVVTDDYGDLVDEIEVTLATGEKLPATVVGTDPLTDLAVVKVEAGIELPAATFSVEEPSVGEYAIAIGSPLGYENSVNLGIVSGLGRSIEELTGTEGVAYNNLIQTDAPISPGNSGGALANASAQVIGINVAYEPPETGAVSIGFAIPAVVVVQVADEIISTGKATHAYLGVSTQTVTSDLQEQFGLSRSSGILVAEVTQGGPAEQAGIKQGDIIIKIDDEDMVESSDVLVAIRDRKPGDTVEVTLDRNGSTKVIAVTLEERPADW